MCGVCGGGGGHTISIFLLSVPSLSDFTYCFVDLRSEHSLFSR